LGVAFGWGAWGDASGITTKVILEKLSAPIDMGTLRTLCAFSARTKKGTLRTHLIASSSSAAPGVFDVLWVLYILRLPPIPLKYSFLLDSLKNKK
jgi:hypothetical protein